ncbi:MAG: hypothetical protein GY827_03100 [Cytophagales bacterium]|nr:hypothetical protein [Cytophagales bacterium]
MLEYKQRILRKVSFDLELFEKELTKATKWLAVAEVEELRRWCYQNFGERYTDILNRCFVGVNITAS